MSSSNKNNKLFNNYTYYSLFNNIYSTGNICNSQNSISGKNKINLINNNSSNLINIESSNKNYNCKNNSNEIKFTVKDDYVDFKVNLENIITGKDKRTTVMLRNIPNKYSLQNLVDEINLLFVGKYDYINLPIDYEVIRI